MDTMFQVLAKEKDWFEGNISSLEIENDSVRLECIHAKSDEIVLPEGIKPAGMAVENNCIYVLDSGNDRLIIHETIASCVNDLVFGSSGDQPYQFRNPTAIAVKDGILYIADTDNNRIQVFYPNFTLKALWCESCGCDFKSPCDIAFDADGNVYVVDRGNKRIVRIDKEGNDSLFCDSTDGVFDPVAITVDCDGFVYVVDSDRKSILVYSKSGVFEKEIELDDHSTLESFDPTCVLYLDNGLFVGDRRNKRLHRISLSGKYEFIVREVINIPYRLASDRDGNIYVSFIDLESVFVISKCAFKKSGIYSIVFDSEHKGCQWHRVLFDAVIPRSSKLDIQTLSSDDHIKPENANGEWNSVVFTGDDKGNDMLVQSPPGRYLCLKIIFEGDGTQSPCLHNLRVFYPRNTYLEYLPAIYQHDPDSYNFLSRFLPIFESVILGIEDNISNSSRYYNPLAAPEEFVPWLASWLDFVLDDKWSADKKRKLIRNAVPLYKKRGTEEGLLDYIEIYTGYRPAIIELFKLRNEANIKILSHNALSFISKSIFPKGYVLNDTALVGNSTIADEWELHNQDFYAYAHRFIVFLYPVHLKDEITKRMVKKILYMEKPAHTQYLCCEIQPMMRVGVQSMVGLDTIVAKDSDEFVVGRSSIIGKDSIIDRKKSGAGFIVGKSSKIGTNPING